MTLLARASSNLSDRLCPKDVFLKNRKFWEELIAYFLNKKRKIRGDTHAQTAR
jgi:hypothetical protein